jgi:hypothetical protein
MYFAAMLFNMTIATTVIISLATPPDEEYRVSYQRTGLVIDLTVLLVLSVDR